MDDYSYYNKKSGQIPAFGNWDYANDLPITQYFECARQAGLIRYSCSGDVDLYSTAKPPQTAARPKSRGGGGGVTDQARRQRQRKKSSDVKQSARKLKDQNGDVYRPKVKIVNIVPKPVDEDLYKIPPELLRTSKKKKMFGFFSRCLVPSCVA
uniref:Uncharacterized protein n=1 Tax=Kalanchoe fedtschenkoi TaxID=63787 RepID=A0A7N0VIC7_KALFE